MQDKTDYGLKCGHDQNGVHDEANATEHRAYSSHNAEEHGPDGMVSPESLRPSPAI